MEHRKLPRQILALNPMTNPWDLIEVWTDLPWPASPVLRDHFLHLVATRGSTPTEVDYLITSGLPIFGYRLRDAVARVEIARLDRLAGA